MNSYRSRARVATAALALALAWVVSSCGTQAAPSGGSATEPSASPERVVTDPDDVLEGFKLVSFDFTPIGSTEELAATAETIVSGTIEEVVTGRLSGTPDDSFAARYSALAVRVDESVKGTVEAGDLIWVEIPTNPEVLQEGLKPGLQIATYLNPSRPSTEREPYSAQGSQIPSGEQLWSLSHPEGLIVQYGATEGTVTPLSEEVDTSGSIDEVVAEAAN